MCKDGNVRGLKENPAVTKELLAEILSWKSNGALDIDIIYRLRQRIVPAGYTPHTWIHGNIADTCACTYVQFCIST